MSVLFIVVSGLFMVVSTVAGVVSILLTLVESTVFPVVVSGVSQAMNEPITKAINKTLFISQSLR